MKNGLEFALGDGETVIVAAEIVFWGFAEEVVNEHLVGEHADNVLVMVDNEEEVAVGTEEGGKGLV